MLLCELVKRKESKYVSHPLYGVGLYWNGGHLTTRTGQYPAVNACILLDDRWVEVQGFDLMPWERKVLLKSHRQTDE